jgi:putative ABC transport system permease protein
MLWQFLRSSLRFRRGRLLLAASSLAVAATLVTTLFNLYSAVEQRIRSEFEGFGANVVLAAANAGTVPLTALEAARRLQVSASPLLLTATAINKQEVPVLGIDFATSAEFHRYWQVAGARIAHNGECLAGSNLAEQFHWELHHSLSFGDAHCELAGIVTSGGSEENQLIVPFAVAQQLARLTTAASVIEIRAPGAKVSAVRDALAAQYPQASVRVVRAVADTESQLVLQIRGALFSLLLIILVITTLCVTSNFSELVLERSREIGLLKAIGAAERRIAGLFLSESVILSGVSSLVGYLVGLVAAASIARSIFGGAWGIHWDALVLITVIGLTLFVSVAATLVAAQRIWRIQPAMILRGE